MEEDGKWGYRSVHNNSAAPELLLPLHYLLLLQSGDIHGPESCRINFLCHGVLHKLQGHLIQHLELLLLTLVSAGLFLTLFFPPHSLLTASALSETCFLWDATPRLWGSAMPCSGLDGAVCQGCPSQTLSCSPAGSKPCHTHLGHRENGRWWVSQHRVWSWNEGRE